VATAVVVGVVLLVLAFAELLIPVGGRGDSMAPTMPAVLVYWPLGRVGVPECDKAHLPPGGPLC
jgi:hypothetical protein